MTTELIDAQTILRVITTLIAFAICALVALAMSDK